MNSLTYNFNGCSSDKGEIFVSCLFGLVLHSDPDLYVIYNGLYVNKELGLGGLNTTLNTQNYIYITNKLYYAETRQQFKFIRNCVTDGAANCAADVVHDKVQGRTNWPPQARL